MSLTGIKPVQPIYDSLNSVFIYIYTATQLFRKQTTEKDWLLNQTWQEKNGGIPWAESKVPQSNKGIIATGEELERRLKPDIQHTSTTTKVWAQSTQAYGSSKGDEGVVNVFIQYFYSTYEIKQSLKAEKNRKWKLFFCGFVFCSPVWHLLSHCYPNMHCRLNN